MQSFKKSKQAKGQNFLPFSNFRSKRRFARHYQIWLPAGKRIKISFRNFKLKNIPEKSYETNLLRFFYIQQTVIRIINQKRRLPELRSWQEVATPFVLILLGLSGGVYSVFNLTVSPSFEFKAIKTPSQPIVASPMKQLGLPAAEPTNISIENLGISAGFIPLGKNSDQTMEVPNEPHLVGWYRLAPTPGEVGPAVIVGHVDSPLGPAIFWQLNQLAQGDTVIISRQDSSTVTFEVVSVEQYPQDNFPTDKVYGAIDYPGLRLITCGGTYDKNTQRYSHNTVVYARMTHSMMDSSIKVMTDYLQPEPSWLSAHKFHQHEQS